MEPTSCPSPKPATEISCVTLCPQDCVVGPWSSWSSCENCRKSSHRTRSVIVAPSNGGRTCPELTEIRSCQNTCPDLSTTTESSSSPRPEGEARLRVGEWGPCMIFSFDQTKGFDYKQSDEDTNATKSSNSQYDSSNYEQSSIEEIENEIALENQKTMAPIGDLPIVGRQVRSLTCLSENNTQLSIK